MFSWEVDQTFINDCRVTKGLKAGLYNDCCVSSWLFLFLLSKRVDQHHVIGPGRRAVIYTACLLSQRCGTNYCRWSEVDPGFSRGLKGRVINSWTVWLASHYPATSLKSLVCSYFLPRTYGQSFCAQSYFFLFLFGTSSVMRWRLKRCKFRTLLQFDCIFYRSSVIWWLNMLLHVSVTGI